MPALAGLVMVLAGCIGGPKLSSGINEPPVGSYGTLAVTVERPTASASSFLLQKLLFPKAHAFEICKRMVRVAVTDLEGTVRVTRDVLAEGKKVSATMRIPARLAYRVSAIECYVEDLGDIWVTRITDVGTTYPVTVGPDAAVTASVTLKSASEVLKPIVTVDSYTAVAGEEVITGTVTIHSNLELGGPYLVTVNRDNTYCERMQNAFYTVTDESPSYFRAMWTIRPIVFDHTDKITCEFFLSIEILEARPSGFGRENDPYLNLIYPDEPLTVTFFAPSTEIRL